MPTLLADRSSPVSASIPRDLLLVWQNARTGRFMKAGLLTVADNEFRFRYLDDAAHDPDFFPLDEFPKIGETYVYPVLPAFFANRVMSSERPSYGEYLRWLGLDAQAQELPVEILVRTGGGRLTDTFHVVEKPVRAAEEFVSRFFVSGVRHQPGTSVHLSALQDGAELRIAAESRNEHNPDAHRVVLLNGEQIGWVPDWLCGEIAELAAEGWIFETVAEKVSPDAPPHVQVLCRIRARRTA